MRRHSVRFSLVHLCLLFAGLGIGLSGCSGKIISRAPAVPMESPYTWDDELHPRRIMVVGDFQPTTWLECEFMGRPQNDAVRSDIINQIVNNKPDMLLLLGDQVGEGEKEGDWLRFDSMMAPICDENIPVYAVVGNHDYGLLGVEGIRHFQARFPYANVLPRLVWLADSVAMVVMDSNLGALPDEVLERQTRRYQEVLKMLDRHPSVRGVIVTMHHPPLTNASLPIDSRVHDLFVPPFLESRKTMLFLSGHIHSYERFEVDGKAFVVSGGGGGPRRSVDTSEGRSIKSDQVALGEMRPHHYMEMLIEPEGIRCETMMLVQDEFKLGDEFFLSYPD